MTTTLIPEASLPPQTEWDIRPQRGPQWRFLTSNADCIVYGGAAGGGKTWALLLDALRYIATPGYRAVIFRRVAPQITNPGGLWDEAMNLYLPSGGVPHRSRLEWAFPSGARIKFGHMQYEDDKREWQGAQVAYVGFDEATHFSEGQAFYLLSRMRSMTGIRPAMRLTCNPDADSWVARFIAWWIDQETGLPIPERSGVIRWFVRDGETLVWADHRADLIAQFPLQQPKSATFIPATVHDNRKLMRRDPGYLANLMAQPRVERERLLGGNWKVVASPRDYFRREWFPIVDAVPVDARPLRWWDLAATEAKKGRDPDYTVGARLARTPDGRLYIEDIRRVRTTPAGVEALVLQTAQLDGRATATWIEQEPGSAGVTVIAGYKKLLQGYDIHGERSTGPKEEYAKPLSAQCEAGNVALVRGDWNGAFLDEAEAFPLGGHDDQVDAASKAFAKLVNGRRQVSFYTA